MAIQGGLGNQLSQWYYAHSISPNSSFRIDPLYKMTGTELRSFELQPLINTCPHLEGGKGKNFIAVQTRKYFEILDKSWEYKSLRRLVEKLGYFREDPRLDQSQSTKKLKVIRYAKGYFQKQEAIEKVFDCVVDELMPLLNNTLVKIKARFQIPPNYTLIHVRRSDYDAAEFTPIIIGTLSDEYYIQGLKGIDTSNLILLTENYQDVSGLVKTLNPCMVLDKSDTNPWETLAIMFGATKFVGANSSLSWWGARLCYSNGGDVWLPSDWSFWNNIDNSDYHFSGSNIAKVYWVQKSLLS